MPRLGVKNIIVGWPVVTREMAEKIIDKYGEPDEATPSLLIWYHNAPWKRTIIYRDALNHNFPLPHYDGIEQFVNYEVPMEKACEIAAFNGSLIIYPTRGEMSSCSDDEAVNVLALNLAHDIMQDKKTFEQARHYYAKYIIEYLQHRLPTYMEKLLFNPDMKTADPDESTISEKEMIETTS